MKRWQMVLPAMIEWLSSGVHQQWRDPAEWRQVSGVSAETFSQMSMWIEAYVQEPILRPYSEIRHVWLALAKQMREELFALLAELEPTHAMALLCHLPTANLRGYSWQRLAGRLHVKEEQLQNWQGQAYAVLYEKVSEQTPFLLFLKQRMGEGAPEVVPETDVTVKTAEPLTPTLIAEAAHNPNFDLRRYLSPGLELTIRQTYHRVGVGEVDLVKTLFAEEDRWLVELVGSRIKLEMTAGEGAGDDA